MKYCFYLEGDQPVVVAAEGEGGWTSANGEQPIKVVLDYSLVAPGEVKVQLSDGSGSWNGTTGYFMSKPSNMVFDVAAGIISYDYEGTGFLTFPPK